MRTTTNFFLGNLALADLCVGIFCIIPNLLLYLSPYWYLGKVMCKLLYFVQMMSYAASITILTVISIERYFAILHPLRCKTWTRLWILRVAVLIIWAASAGTGIPHLILRDAVSISGLSFCIVINVQFNRQAYVTANFIVWYVLPLSLMSVMYFKISVVLWNTSKLDRLSTNALKHWRQQKKVKYTLTAAAEQNEHTMSCSGPRISIEDQYPQRCSGSSEEGGEEEGARGAPVSDVTTCGVTWRNSCSGSMNGEVCSDLLSVQTGSVVVTPEEDAACLNASASASLVAHKDLVPPRKGSNANPNKIGAVSPDITDVLSLISVGQREGSIGPSELTSAVPAKGRVTNQNEATAPVTHGQQKIASIQTPKCMGARGNIKAKGNWDQILNKVAHKPFAGRWPLQRGESALLARRRVIRLLMVVIGCFAVCVLPYHVFMLVNEYFHTEPSFLQEIMNPITFLIFYSNSALNPILYAFLSDNFRKSLWELLRYQTCRRRRAAVYRQPMTAPSSSRPIAPSPALRAQNPAHARHSPIHPAHGPAHPARQNPVQLGTSPATLANSTSQQVTSPSHLSAVQPTLSAAGDPGNSAHSPLFPTLSNTCPTYNPTHSPTHSENLSINSKHNLYNQTNNSTSESTSFSVLPPLPQQTVHPPSHSSLHENLLV